MTISEVSAALPRGLILNLGDQTCAAVLVAATEGMTRFVAGAPGDRGAVGGCIPSAIELLSTEAGIPLTMGDFDAGIVRGKPVRLLIVGDETEVDDAAIGSAVRDGTAITDTISVGSTRRKSHDADTVRTIVGQIDVGIHDALIILLPAGTLPAWAARLFTALGAPPVNPGRNIITVAADTSISEALPHGAVLLKRDDTLPRALIDSLTSIRARGLARDLPGDVPVMSFVQAVAAGMDLARQEAGGSLLYLEVSEGGTLVLARPSGIYLVHDPDGDAAAGAVTLLKRFGVDAVARWIPFAIEAAALQAWAVRRVAAPGALLTDPADLAIAGGFARAALGGLIEQLGEINPPPSCCVIGSSLLHYDVPAHAMLTVADILHTSGPMEVLADADDLLPVVGYLAASAPDSARSLLRDDTLMPLGTLVTLPASGRRRGGVVEARLDGPTESSRTAIAKDGLTAIPTMAGGKMRLIRDDGREEVTTVRGGPHGIVIDTRARPLSHGAGVVDARRSVSDRLRTALAVEGAEDA